jgi:hypothetical protein
LSPLQSKGVVNGLVERGGEGVEERVAVEIGDAIEVGGDGDGLLWCLVDLCDGHDELIL